MSNLQRHFLIIFLGLSNLILSSGQKLNLQDDVDDDGENILVDRESETQFVDEETSAPVSPPPPPFNFNVFAGDSSLEEETQAGHAPNGLQILVAIFFFVATAWLLIAVFYALMALIVLRLRSRGRLDLLNEEFGRLYLCGNRWYIPFGCILRRYVVTFGHDQARGEARSRSSDYKHIRRSERRQAIEQILLGNLTTNIAGGKYEIDEELAEYTTGGGGAATTAKHESDCDSVNYPDPEPSATSNSEGPVCSICLAGYGTHKHCQSFGLPCIALLPCVLNGILDFFFVSRQR